MKTELTAEKLLEIKLIVFGGMTLQINDNRIKEACINAINEAINYTPCCTKLKTFDIHECINEVTKSANKLSPWIVDARKDRSFRYRIKKAIDKMLYSN
jgi:hypothetical protein